MHSVLQRGVRRGEGIAAACRPAPSAAASPRRSLACVQPRARRKQAAARACVSPRAQRRRLRREARSEQSPSLPAHARTAGQAKHVHSDAARAQRSDRGREEPASHAVRVARRSLQQHAAHMDSSSGCAMTNKTGAPGVKRSAAAPQRVSRSKRHTHEHAPLAMLRALRAPAVSSSQHAAVTQAPRAYAAHSVITRGA